jgi:tRNA (cmo5U34)-methyltransferase
LALHHLETDKQKKDFYRNIFDNLTINGIFINADVVLGSTDYWQDLNMQKWIEYMNQSVSIEEIQKNWIPKYESEDRPAILIDQIQWLKEIGYKNVDVIWKYFNFSVYGAIK